MSVDQLVPLISGTGGATFVLLFFLSLILSGKLHTDGEFQRAITAGEKETEAHNETKRALAASNERADAAVRASEIIANALSGPPTVQRRSSRVHKTPTGQAP